MRKKNLEKEITNALYKKAFGYDTNEVVEEFVLDEGGDYKLSKRKVTKKHISPDLSAVKMLLDKLETKTEVYSDMTEEELMREKLRLLEILENYKK
ncbi:MAG: hypothetical protein MR423_03280 [Firmicutes bacterium]|nr:hypothetical protein [Bacillota bacterium]MDY3659171.1 hypothetical protein [Eubacteriales bacterium]